MAQDRLLTKAEAAAELGVSVKTIERRLKKGDLARVLVHGPHGPEVRVVFPATPDVTDATFTVADTTPGEAATPDSLATVEGVAPWTPASTDALLLPESEAVALLLGVLDERQRKIEDWAVRYGRLEAEVESLRRPWWKRFWDKRR